MEHKRNIGGKMSLLEKVKQIKKVPGMFFGADYTVRDLFNFLLGWDSANNTQTYQSFHYYLMSVCKVEFNDVLNVDFSEAVQHLEDFVTKSPQKILSCPFKCCYSRAPEIELFSSNGHFWYQCLNCKTCGPKAYIKENAAIFWNERSADFILVKFLNGLKRGAQDNYEEEQMVKLIEAIKNKEHYKYSKQLSDLAKEEKAEDKIQDKDLQFEERLKNIEKQLQIAKTALSTIANSSYMDEMYFLNIASKALKDLIT